MYFVLCRIRNRRANFMHCNLQENSTCAPLRLFKNLSFAFPEKARGVSRTSELCYWTTWRHISAYSSLHSQRRHQLRIHKILASFHKHAANITHSSSDSKVLTEQWRRKVVEWNSRGQIRHFMRKGLRKIRINLILGSRVRVHTEHWDCGRNINFICNY